MSENKEKVENKENEDLNLTESGAENKGTEEVAAESTTEEVSEESTTEEVAAESAPEEVAAESTTEEVAAESAPEEVVTESAGEMVEEEKPILKEKKEKKVKAGDADAAVAAAAAAASPEEFDWDAYEKGGFTAQSSRADQEKLYEETLSTVAVDEVVEGKVISMNNREVVINIGQKSEGVVSLNEFRYNPDLKVGDMVEVYVDSQEDKRGQLVLSHKKARAYNSWDRVNSALENNEIITGYIKCRTKGGMIVDVFGIESFLPGSQIDVKPIRDYDVYVGKTMEFKVVKINQEFKSLSSRRRRSSPSLKRDRSSRVLSRTSPPTVYSLIWAALTGSFTSPIFHGAGSTIPRRLYSLTRS